MRHGSLPTSVSWRRMENRCRISRSSFQRPPVGPPVSYQTIFLARESRKSANPAPMCASQGVTVVLSILQSELHSLLLQHKPGHWWLNSMAGSWSITLSFSYNCLSLCLLYCLATVRLSGRVKHGFVVAGIEKGQTSGNALNWGACYLSVRGVESYEASKMKLCSVFITFNFIAFYLILK